MTPFFLPTDRAELVSLLSRSPASPHGGMASGAPPLCGDAAREAWRNTAPETARRMLYIHVPFCMSRCSFCGFYSNRTTETDLADYTDLLIRELKHSVEADAFAKDKIDVVYFGGGTPTDLSAADLRRLIRFLYDELNMAADVEFTIEGRLFGFDDEKVNACVEAGATRFSFGVQAFETQLRRHLGRKLSREELIERLIRIKEISGDRAAVIIDLIYGLPGQTQDDWLENVRTAVEEAPLDGADLYLLKMLPGTPLAKQFPEAAPWSEEEMLNRYTEGCRFMKNRNWQRLSISHWGKSPLERNRYNHWTKTGTDLLPFGCGAGGSLGGWSFMQLQQLDEYKTQVAAGLKPVGLAMKKTPHHRLKSQIADQMERGFFDPPSFSGIEFSLLIENWTAAGVWAKDEKGICRLTTLGEFYQPRLSALLAGFCSMSAVPGRQ